MGVYEDWNDEQRAAYTRRLFVAGDSARDYDNQSLLIDGSQYQALTPWDKSKFTFYGNGYYRLLPEYVDMADTTPTTTVETPAETPASTSVEYEEADTSALDTAILERLKEEILGTGLERDTNALREWQNQRGVIHSDAASEQEQRLADDARNEYNAAEMSLYADEQQRNLLDLSSSANLLQSSINTATNQYQSAYSQYLTQLANYQNNQSSWSELGSSWLNSL